MATMIVELYDALKAAGAPDDKAQAAAMALVNTNGRFDRIDGRLAVIERDIATIKSDVAGLKGEFGMMKWVLSGIAAGVVVQIVRSFWLGA